ncbi:11571_t:CDS:10 [Gigaspora margarita]|uniref:11571_t:CDS:1 n=1 Tax=Gigaspora margarita TaxID=4874 RepID=A0ABN7UE33_GIGMA|nr:11571_t:CDS:10 [Gigaspora margarita]
MTGEKELDSNIANCIKLKAGTNGSYQNIVNSKAVTEQSKSPNNKDGNQIVQKTKKDSNKLDHIMNEENLQKRNADLMEESESSSEIEEYATNKKSHSHYKASCYYCVPKKSWARGKPAILEAYLANECSNSLPNQTAITTYFLSDCLLPKAAVNQLDQKIAKVWVMAGIPFEVSKIHLLKICLKIQINCAIDRDIDRADHLTLANEISNIIEKLGLDKFVAIVTDAASNSHMVNLIAADLVKLDELKKLIANCGKINHFFNSSHSSHSLLIKGFTDMKIKVKTRWGSLYFTTDSMLRARPVFDWHLETITNQEIANLLANKDFFITCQLVRSIWQPIKEVIYALETNTATLADCFVYLIKLAVAIKQKCLKDNRFYQAALTSIEIWQNLGHTELESNELIAQMRWFEAQLPPFNLPYVSGIDTPKIWLEEISKIRSYYTTNIQHELSFPDKELTETDLRDACNLSLVGNIISYEENKMDNDDEPLSNTFNYSTIC